VFDSVASADDLEAALLLETLTNDRVNETLARLGELDRSEWVTASRARPRNGGVFATRPRAGGVQQRSAGRLVLLVQIETAIAETVHHHTKRAAHSASGFRHMIQMRELMLRLRVSYHVSIDICPTNPRRAVYVVHPRVHTGSP